MLNTWWLLAIISGAGLATRNLFFKGISAKIDAPLAALILSAAMAAVTVLYFAYDRMLSQTPSSSPLIDTRAIVFCVLAGVGVAGANIFLAYAYKAGGYASLTALLQNGFSIVVTIILGALLLGEVIKPMQLLGIIITFFGIYLVTKK